MKNSFAFIVVALTQLSVNTKGQTYQNGPIARVGEPCPIFTLSEIFNSKEKYYSSGGTTTKWTILDFWSTGCPSCISGFPKLNQLQRSFADQLNVILVGKPDKYIRKMYSKLKEHYQMNVPYTFDSGVFKTLNIEIMPYALVIDPKGIVRSIPFPQDLDSAALVSLFTGKEPDIRQLKDYVSIPSSKDIRRMDSVEHAADSMNKMLFRSELGLASYDMPTMRGQEDFVKNKWSNYRRNGIDIYCMDLATLYQIAYTGRTFIVPEDSLFADIYARPILETEDSIKFQSSSFSNPFIYNYSLRVPETLSTDSFLMKTMQRDLGRYFRFEVQLERRMMPYFAVTVRSATLMKIKTKGGAPSLTNTNGATGFIMKNLPMATFFDQIWKFYQWEPKIIDETGISGNIDVSVNGILTDITSLKKALQKSGFDLVQKQKMMTVMVVRDAKKSPLKNNELALKNAKDPISYNLK